MPTTGDVTTNTIKHIAIETNDNDSNRKEYRSIGADGINVDIYRDSDTGEIITDNMLPVDPEPTKESVAEVLHNHEENFMKSSDFCNESDKIVEEHGGIGDRNFLDDEIPSNPTEEYNTGIATGETVISIRNEISDTKEDINSNFAESYDSSATYQNGDFSLDSDGVLQKFNGTDWVPKNVTDEIKDMKSTFQNGVDTIYSAEVAQGVSGVPAASTPRDLANGVGAIATAKYNAGIEYAQSFYWSHEVSINANATNIFGDYDKNVSAITVINGNLSNIRGIRTNSYIDNDILTITFTKNGETLAYYTNVGRNVDITLPQEDFDKVSFRVVKKPGTASTCYISAGVTIEYIGKVLRNGRPPFPIITI